jgi:hypothetical protein
VTPNALRLYAVIGRYDDRVTREERSTLNTAASESDAETDILKSRDFRVTGGEHRPTVWAHGRDNDRRIYDLGISAKLLSNLPSLGTGFVDTSALSKLVIGNAGAAAFAGLGSNLLGGSPLAGLGSGLIDISAKQVSATAGAAAFAGHGSSLLGVTALAGFGSGLVDISALSRLVSKTASISAFSVPVQMTGIAAMSGRLTSLSLGFGAEGSGFSRGFGRLHRAIASDGPLDQAVLGAIESTQTRGAFGLDFRGLRDEASRVSQALGDNPDMEQALAGPLDEVMDLTGFDDEVLIDLGEALGWWDRIRTHRVSTAGLVLGFTVGLARFVVAGGSPSQLPLNVFESIAYGGGLYMAIHNSE